MPQLRSPFAKARTHVQDSKENFRVAYATVEAEDRVRSMEGRSSDHPRSNLAALIVGEPFRVVLYGFIVAGPGVLLLPWGELAGIAVTLTGMALLLSVSRALIREEAPAGRAGHSPRRRGWFELTLFALALASAVLASTAVPASLVSAGVLVVFLMRIARHRPYVYALVGGVMAVRLLMAVLGQTLYSGPQWALTREILTPDESLRQAALVTAVVFLGGMQHLSGWQTRTERQRAEAAERARDEAAAGERARIARELHDVVSHHVTAMTLQAEAAMATGDRGALQSLATSGREAAAELRRMLGVLRHPTEQGPTDPPDPQPRLTDVDSLADRLSGGVEVTVERTGDPRSLPAGVELCAYRVIQEALTNVAKHSDADRATVAIDYAPRCLTLEVLDGGQPAQRVRESGGHGLIGMRERVTLLDGELEAGPRDGRAGYRVFAKIPL